MTVRDWWQSLSGPPTPLSSRERLILLAASLLAAASRLLALARTPWDWDELLFMLSLDRFDVAQHRPHPPGFPLYVLTAKIVRKLGLGNFHALQAVSLLAAMALVPAMFLLCREMRMRFSTSLSAALLLAFFPNVWFFGGTAFSDVPSMVLVLVAMVLLLRGCRDGRWYLGGALLLAIAAGYRPQNLSIGFAPLLMATWFQRRRPLLIVAAASILGSVIAVSYGTAAWLTGIDRYRAAVAEHRDYITVTDSFRAPRRPPLWRVFEQFFVEPYHAPWINALVTMLVACSGVVSLVRRRPHVLAALASFGPFCIAAWLMLDRFSTSRFSIGYAPLVALLAADGLALIARKVWLESVGTGALALLMIGWSWPALGAVRSSIAPPVAVVDWIRNHVEPHHAVVYVDAGMIPYALWYLPEYQLRFCEKGVPPPAAWTSRVPGYYLAEGTSTSPSAFQASRPHGRVWDVVRHRYFDVAVRPVTEMIVFGDGWYDEEQSGTRIWRWMGARATVDLPPVRGSARLTLDAFAPLDALKGPPLVTVSVDGAVLDRFRATKPDLEREWIVEGGGAATRRLMIETDGVVTPSASHAGSDTRTLGLRVNSIGWQPVRATTQPPLVR